MLLIFTLFVFGFCFLLADARIFGCDAYGYKQIYEDPEASGKDLEYARTCGILRIRQHLLKFHFVRELLSCYFCMGVWVGAAAHPLFRWFFGAEYILWHPNTTHQWLGGLLLASVLGASASFVFNSISSFMEA